MKVSDLLGSVVDPWPTGVVVDELLRRRAELRACLEGDLLEVVGPVGVGPRTLERLAGERTDYDHVVAIGWLSAANDLDAAVGDLLGRLSPTGYLHLLEPTLSVGVVAGLQQRAASVGRRRTGWWIDRDIPAAVRRSGLMITDLERFSMPVRSLVLQPWVLARACRPVATPFDHVSGINRRES